MPIKKIYFSLVVLIAMLLSVPVPAVTTDPPDIEALIARLDNGDVKIRSDAAEALAQIVDAKISEPVRKRIAVEKDFHVRLALYYALASQGEKEPVSFLIDSLQKTGHLGYVYLRRVTGRDFGWDIDKYREWYDNTSDEQFRSMILEQWKRKPMMDEWGEFVSLYQKKYFSPKEGNESDGLSESRNDDMRITREEIERLSKLPTAEAWNIFQSALLELQKNGNREEAARLFHKVATEFSNTYYVDQSKELANLLDSMVDEDNGYTPPKDIDSLDLKDQIAVHIHYLRDVVAHQISQPGYCNIFLSAQLSKDKSYNAAVALRDIGEPAIPYLIELLNDRRPIRAVGY